MPGRRRGRGEGAISKRTDGRWMGRVDLGCLNGRRRYKAVYGKTRRDVAGQIHTMREKLKNGQQVFDTRVTVGDWLTHWLDAIVQPRVRSATHASYGTMARMHIKPHLGHLRLPELAPEHVRLWLIKLQKDGASISLGYVKDELAESDQTVRGLVIALKDDQ